MENMNLIDTFSEFKELKKKTTAELNRLLAETRDKLRDLRFKDANKQLKDVRQVRKLKKLIANILTIMNKGVAPDKSK